MISENETQDQPKRKVSGIFSLTSKKIEDVLLEHNKVIGFFGAIAVGIFFTYVLSQAKVSFGLNIALSGFVAILSYFLIEFALYIPKVYSSLNKFNDSIDPHFTNIFARTFENKFAEVLASFFKAHDCIFSDVYTSYPNAFIEKIGNSMSGRMTIGRSGITIWGKKVETDTYAEIVEDLLTIANDSVYSTTYYPSDKLCKMVAENDSKVNHWWQSINDRRQVLERLSPSKKLEICRVHLFDDQGEYDDFLRFFRGDTNAKKNYCDLYAPTWATLWGYINPKNVKDFKDTNHPDFFGECIIFDKQVAICYNLDFEQCTIYCGRIAEELAEPFKVDVAHEKKRLTKKLIYKDIRKDLCA